MTLKQIAGEKAVEYIEDGMVVGLGSGTTAFYTIQKIAERVSGGLKITGVCTSEDTRKLAEKWKIPYLDINEVDRIDLTIDGADEVDSHGHGIKGGGGALLYEKIVASNSVQNIWVVEQRKLVEHLGEFPLPVEITAFGYKRCIARLSDMGLKPELRMRGKDIFLTDSAHYIVDLQTGMIEDPFALDRELKQIAGVIEHGLFLSIVDKVVAAGKGKVDIITFR